MGITLEQLTSTIGKVKNYVNNKFPVVSPNEDNAILLKENGIFVENKQPQIDNIKSKLNPIARYQKYVNTELDSCFCKSSEYTPIVGEYVPFEKVSGSFVVNNGRVIVKPGQRVQINVVIGYYGGSNSSNIGYFIKDYTNDYSIASINPCNSSSDKKYEFPYAQNCQYTNETDKDCEIGLYVRTVNVSDTLAPSYTTMNVQEINRAITIDPLEHVNATQGIEDAPVGHIISHMGTTAPSHYLICDGAEYNITDYPYLAQHFEDNFGSVNYFGGDGTTTFAVPNIGKEYTFFSPKMTSNNSPSPYVVTASSYYSYNFSPYCAFDNQSGTAWASKANESNPWIKIDIGSSIALTTLRITSTYENSVATKFVIEGSNDDVNYITLRNYSTSSWNPSTTRDIHFDEDKSGCYRYIKITITNYNGNYGEFGDIQLGKIYKINCIKYEPTYFMHNTYNGVFPDFTNLIAQIKTPGTTYTATENCVAIMFAKQTDSSMAQVVVGSDADNGVQLCSSAVVVSTNSNAYQGNSSCCYLKAGETISTRSHGSYNVRIFGLQS